MTYFRVSQDMRYGNAITFNGLLNLMTYQQIHSGQIMSLPEFNIMKIRSDKWNEYLDVLSRQIFVVRQPIKQVFKLFEPSLPIKRVILLDDLNGTSQPYYIPVFKKLECLADGSRYNPDKSILHHGVLDRSIIADTPFFKLGGAKNTYIVVRLDVAECILRRNPRGIDFEELTVTNGGVEECQIPKNMS